MKVAAAGSVVVATMTSEKSAESGVSMAKIAPVCLTTRDTTSGQASEPAADATGKKVMLARKNVPLTAAAAAPHILSAPMAVAATSQSRKGKNRAGGRKLSKGKGRVTAAVAAAVLEEKYRAVRKVLAAAANPMLSAAKPAGTLAKQTMNSLDKDDSVQSSLQGVSVTLTQNLPVTRGGGEIEGGTQQLAKSVILLGKMGIEIIVYLYTYLLA